MGEDAASAAEVVLTHPLDIGSPAAEPAMLEASQEPVLDIAPALGAPGEPVQGALIESPEMAVQAGALGTQDPDVAAESSHAQAAEAAPGQADVQSRRKMTRTGVTSGCRSKKILIFHSPCLQPGRLSRTAGQQKALLYSCVSLQHSCPS